MVNAELIQRIYPDMYAHYAVPRWDLPVGFQHREKMDLGMDRNQETYASCGRSMARVGMKVQNIFFNHRSPSHRSWLRDLVPTRYEGIDPHPLANGIKATGVECQEYQNSDVDFLVELLRACPSVCILALQAPWCKLEDITQMNAGHYVAAGHVDLRKREVLVHDTGNGSPWGRIKLNHLGAIWHDNLIGRRDKVVEGWMLHIPVKNS